MEKKVPLDTLHIANNILSSKITMVETLSKLLNYMIFLKFLRDNQKGMEELAIEGEYK